MGYVLFASRKIALTNQLNMLQVRLEDVMNEKLRLLNYSANVADGVASTDDFVDDFTNAKSYSSFNLDTANYIKTVNYADTLQSAEVNYMLQNTNISSKITDQNVFNAKTVADKHAELITHLNTWSASCSGNEATDFQKALTAYSAEVETKIQDSLCKEFYQNTESKRIAALETELEMKQKKIESQISAVQADLSSCEQAEAKGIQNATPKYAGLA